MNRLKKYALLICIALVSNNSSAQWSDWVINYENGIPVSTTPDIHICGRPAPFFTYYRFDNNRYVIKGRILHKHCFLKLRNTFDTWEEEKMWDKNSPLQFREPRPDLELYSLELEVLDDFGKNLPETIVLVPDTCGGYYYKDDYWRNITADDTGYFFFYQNKAGQLCYSHVMYINDNRVKKILTRWDILLGVIKETGMPVPRFERKLKRKIK